jgi:hypothetical protein
MKHADNASDQHDKDESDARKKTYRQRWRQTSVANQALVITGTLVAFSSLVYTVTTIFLAIITYWNIQETSKQTDKLVAASEKFAKTTGDALQETQRSNAESANRADAAANRAERATMATENAARSMAKQADASNKSATSMDKVATAAKESAQIAQQAYIASQRAEIVLDNFHFTYGMPANTPWRFACNVQNNGAPAIRLTGSAIVDFRPAGNHESLPCLISKSERVEIQLNKGRVGGAAFRLPTTFSQAEITALDAGTWTLLIYGAVWYEDKLGNKEVLPYCQVYDRDWPNHLRECPTWAINECQTAARPK